MTTFIFFSSINLQFFNSSIIQYSQSNTINPPKIHLVCGFKSTTSRLQVFFLNQLRQMSHDCEVTDSNPDAGKLVGVMLIVSPSIALLQPLNDLTTVGGIGRNKSHKTFNKIYWMNLSSFCQLYSSPKCTRVEYPGIEGIDFWLVGLYISLIIAVLFVLNKIHTGGQMGLHPSPHLPYDSNWDYFPSQSAKESLENMNSQGYSERVINFFPSLTMVKV